jgi:hypothetical protein
MVSVLLVAVAAVVVAYIGSQSQTQIQACGGGLKYPNRGGDGRIRIDCSSNIPKQIQPAPFIQKLGTEKK